LFFSIGTFRFHCFWSPLESSSFSFSDPSVIVIEVTVVIVVFFSNFHESSGPAVNGRHRLTVMELTRSCLRSSVNLVIEGHGAASVSDGVSLFRSFLSSPLLFSFFLSLTPSLTFFRSHRRDHHHQRRPISVVAIPHGTNRRRPSLCGLAGAANTSSPK